MISKIEIRAAKVISFVLHPLLIPTYASLIIFNLNYFFFFILPVNVKLMLLAYVFGLTFLMPASFVYFMKRYAIIKSYYMEANSERNLPLIIAAVFYFMTFYMFRNVNLPSMYYNFFLFSSIITLITLIINFIWKVSLHTISIGAMTGLLLSLMIKFYIDTRLWILISVFLFGLTGTARLMLNTHKSSQIYAGYIIGFTAMLSLYLFVM